MKTFEVTLRIPMEVQSMFEKFLEISSGQEYDELQKQLYNTVTGKLMNRKSISSRVIVERDDNTTLSVTNDRGLYYERTVYDLNTKNFTWEMVIRGIEKLIQLTSSGTIEPDGDRQSIYRETTKVEIALPLAGSTIERAIWSAITRDVDSKKKYYEQKLGTKIEVVSISAGAQIKHV